MKQLFVAALLLCSGLLAAIQNVNAQNYEPHLVDRDNHFEVGLGANFSGAFSATLHGGYFLTHRINASADMSYGRYYKEFLANMTYTYEAIPSLRGGFYFNLGLSAGVGATTYDRYVNWSPIIGPTIIFSHHIFDHLSLAARATGNALALLNDEWVWGSGAVMMIYQF